MTTVQQTIKDSRNLTLLITGESSENVHKHDLANLFVSSYDEFTKGNFTFYVLREQINNFHIICTRVIIKVSGLLPESTSEIFVFTNSFTMPVAIRNTDFASKWNELELPTNVTTLIITRIGIDKMNANQIDIVHRLIMNDNSLAVIEFGNPNFKTHELLEKSALCQMKAHIVGSVPNVVQFCNNATPQMLSSLNFENISRFNALPRTNIGEKQHSYNIWPNFFATAAKFEEELPEGIHDYHNKRRHYKPLKHNQHNDRHFDENVEDIVDIIMEDIIGQNGTSSTQISSKEQSKADKKKMCKYRKSCYETGIKPIVENYYANPFSHWWNSRIQLEGNKSSKDEMNQHDTNEELPIQKLQCKYRHSCYQKHGIPFQKKVKNGEQNKLLHLSKSNVPQHGKKTTLKEVAAETLKKLEEAKEKVFKRPLVKAVDKHLNAIEEKLNEKLNCKYRKSCYETELEKKLYCKYRKSCYETGVKPEIEPEISIDNLRDLTTLHEQIETRKQTLQEKCKYRKSCYETGIIPEINPKLEAAINTEVSSVIPTNIYDLRLFCKYRKSCYAKIHDSATVDTIRLIRKRGQITKEVRRRRSRRAKLHRRLRGEMVLGHYRKLQLKTNGNVNFQLEEDLELSRMQGSKKIPKQTPEKKDEELYVQPVVGSNKGKRTKQQLVKESAQGNTLKHKEATAEKKEKKGKKLKREEQLFKTPTTAKNADESGEASINETMKPSKPMIRPEVDDVIMKGGEQQNVVHMRKDDKKKLNAATQTMNRLISEMHRQKEEQERKEFCKYRKSCYETGRKPEIKQSFRNLFKVLKEHVDQQEHVNYASSKAESDKKLDCKYRKSCYGVDEYSSISERIDIGTKGTYSATKPRQGVNEWHDTTEYKEGIDKEQSNCKLCYSSAQYRTINNDHISIIPIGLERYRRNGKCSPYYYSCREILGLPPKERAPIGPNGKRLCRKKKPL
ncbi:hypothetical protein DICVIV_07535 [Dictyocaulus viviparus]|uniref:Uncharacterized protein n=1 Tax=Dictyocaulus viviparus TaxID=29172 RepID=A0A0D8XRM1_DICVI|nr:hypothetical protein DICVIV_07535 [Dictyocaulus viviparus]